MFDRNWRLVVIAAGPLAVGIWAATQISMLRVIDVCRAAPRDGTTVYDSSATTSPTTTSIDGDDWPSFLGRGRDSKSSETGILTDWRDDRLKTVWQRELGEGYGIGSCAAGRWFQFDRIDDRERLVCLDARTGRQQWKLEYPVEYEDLYGFDGGPRSSPIVDENRVYSFGVSGWLHCLDVETGDVIWKLDTSKKFGVIQNFFGVGSTPVIDGDLLITMIGGSPDGAAKKLGRRLDRAEPNGSGIVAFDKRTGEVRYQIIDDLASYSSPIVRTIDDRKWCFAFCRTSLFGFDPQTGEVDFQFRWRARKLESVNAATPVVAGDRVFITESYGPGAALLRVKPGGYDVIWREDRQRDKSIESHWMTPIEQDGFVYGCSGQHSSTAELRCIELESGKVRWSVPGLGRTSITLVDGHLIVLGENGRLLLVKAQPDKYELVTEYGPAPADGGKRASSSLLKYPCWAAPVVSQGLLYVQGKQKLVCFELIPRQR